MIRRLLFNRYLLVIVLTMVGTLWVSSLLDSARRPDLKRLFAESKMVNDQPPVIFIHGVLGSKLRDKQSGEEVWFSSPIKLVFDEFKHLAYDIDPDTLEVADDRYEPYELAGDIIGKDFYGNIVKTLNKFGGYELAIPGTAVDPSRKNYYIYIYDWRQDNVVNAAKLADLVDQIRIDYNQPDLKVDIVAHSMGGLIARYFMRYGRTDVIDDNDFPVNLYGAERVRRVILLGTPNLGSVKMLNAFIDGIGLGFQKIGAETLATMPSLYQLLPHPLNDWLITANGDTLKRDLFDVEIWRRFQWSIFAPDTRARIREGFTNDAAADEYLAVLERYFEKRLERARRFVWSLTVPLPEPHPTLVVFGGDCHLTPARILVEEVEGSSVIRMKPNEIERPVAGIDYQALLLEPGDTAVTKASLLGRNVLDPSVPRHEYSFFPLDHAILLCEKHNALTGNVSFQDNLLNALLVRD